MTRARITLGCLVLTLASAASAAPRLVASTPPVHSLVAAVAGERAPVELLVPAGRSPHAYALTPSDTRALANADAVFVGGDVAERFLERPLAAVAADADLLRMTEAKGVRVLPARSGGVWATAGHEAHDDASEDHGGGTRDPHVWLDPHNAIAFTVAVADVLADLDPDHAAFYRDNANRRIRHLERLDGDLASRLEPVQDVPYMVFHDAYQYFEARYGLRAVGSITVDPGRPPGAERLAALRGLIRERGAVCVFTEPQFEPAIARTIVDDTDARLAELDPLGAGLSPGAELYPALMRSLATHLAQCLRRSA